VGVGTNSPTGVGARLVHIKDSSASNQSAELKVQGNYAAGLYIENGDARARFYSSHTTHATYGGFLFEIGSQSAKAGTPVMRILSNGNVGIGTSTPGFMLQVDEATAASYAASIRNSNDNLQLKLGTTTGSLLNIQGSTISTDAAYNFSLQADGGCVGIGTTTPGYTLEVNGSFGATTKSFVIDHPTKPDKKLQYASLEGPEHSVYLRGRSQYKIIDLPDYWPELVHEESITVQLTPVNRYQKLFVDKIWNNAVHVSTDKLGERLDYFYNIYAERKDVAKLEVEIDK
jgi:hypothetical protein